MRVSAGTDPFDTGPPRKEPDVSPDADNPFLVRLDVWEGPLDVLLELAKRQKVDLLKISVTALVDQYLAFVDEAKARDLELAADYLVMASWLTYLKSRLLLPAPKTDGEEPSGDDMSRRLAFQLLRLDAMRTAAGELTARPQLHQDVFPRGVRDLTVETDRIYQASLFDLLRAYGDQRVRGIAPVLRREPPKVYGLEAARTRIAAILGDIPEWALLSKIGAETAPEVPSRSVIASHFVAALEYARNGAVELRQGNAFAPLYIRRAAGEETTRDP